ncbi:MAG: hypothetical protein M3Q45_06075, partial [Chloroflexota bacterium]|nr:hypothetical protein [Chloroflexota bacterium]
MRKLQRWSSKISLLVALLPLLLNQFARPASAQSGTDTLLPPLRITAAADGVYLDWNATTTGETVAVAALTNLPTQRYQGYDLPIQLVTLTLAEQMTASALQVAEVESIAWTGDLQPAAPYQPPAVEWNEYPDLLPVATVALPTAPVFILRQGQINGQM